MISLYAATLGLAGLSFTVYAAPGLLAYVWAPAALVMLAGIPIMLVAHLPIPR